MNEKLMMWQKRLKDSEIAYKTELEKMDAREKLYGGIGSIAPYVRNICAELIESQVDSTIPSPKVTAMRKGDEGKARIIENALRAMRERMCMRSINDINERTSKIQGGCFLMGEWDESKKSPISSGEVVASAPHPKQIIPQKGVYSDIEDMDYIFLKIPQTKGYIERRYGKKVDDEKESDPTVRSVSGEGSEDMVTEIIAYFRNRDGGVGRYCFVNDIELEDIEDFNARWTSKCSRCSEIEPAEDSPDPNSPLIIEGGEKKGKRKVCPKCGGTHFIKTKDEYETITVPIFRNDGSLLGGKHPAVRVTEKNGKTSAEIAYEGLKIPYYNPKVYPIVLQKNVSLFGSFLGDSDIDKLSGYQNAIKRLDAKIISKLISGGSILSLPENSDVSTENSELRVVRIGQMSDKDKIGVFTLEGEISQDIAYRERIYEEAKQAIGVTDSFLGRIDRTATSGKAKEFSAAQAAGRMESKRVMKEEAWARFYELCFKLMLAFDDDRRPVPGRNIHGDIEFEEFYRYDFLEEDEYGRFFWNDMFLFECDTTSPLSGNREAMWQETRMNLQTGAFGPPQEIDTLIFFWTKMEELHYPGAGEVKKCLEEKKQQSEVIAKAKSDAASALGASQNQISPAQPDVMI